MELPHANNVWIFSDGGTPLDCLASAWVIGVLDEELHFKPWVTGGIFYAKPISSFLVEAIALEEATKEFLKVF